MSKNTKYNVGDIIGQLTILEELKPHVTPNGSRQRIVRCQCSCGEILTLRLTSALKSQKCRKCAHKETRVDVTGKRFGKLVVLSMDEDYISPSGNRLSRCKCLCDCGKTTVVTMSALVTGKTKSCGCLSNPRGLLKDNQELVQKYDFEKNTKIGLDFETLTARTSKKAWWKCNECGNSWYTTIASQNDRKKHGCPYCARKRVAQNIYERSIESNGISRRYTRAQANKEAQMRTGNFAECYPDLLAEWNYEKMVESILPKFLPEAT